VSDTFLPPIEKPQGLMMKLAFYFTRRQFGRVLTPLKVHSARLPPAFGMFYGKVAKLDGKLHLRRELVFLIREQVARINICLFCMDIGRWAAIKESMNEAKLDALEHYATSALFTDAERAALDYVTELTKAKNPFGHLSSRIGRKALLPECLFFFIKNLQCLHLTIYTRCRIGHVAFWCKRYPRGYPYLIPLSRRGGIICVHFCERNLYWRHRRWRLSYCTPPVVQPARRRA